jgi:hypothetical protein
MLYWSIISLELIPMISKRLLALAAACTLTLLAACGGGDGVPLGEFPAITKTEGDAPFELKAPTSKSPAAFSFDSSDPKIATIAGNMVTVHAAGTATITARQGSLGSYNPTSISTSLTVKERTCVAGAVRKEGLCVPPDTKALAVTRNGVTWLPTTSATRLTWTEADAFCKNISYQGKTGWSLPGRSDLADLFNSGAVNGQGWTLGDTWSATADTDKTHIAVDLAAGTATSLMSDNKLSVTCVLAQG